jgi:hypothetical protein
MSTLRWLAVPAAALVLTLLAAVAPLGFRHMDAFRVRRVEVLGTRYMPAESALAATGITDSSSVFEDLAGWTQALRDERMVADARLLRRLPGTLRIEVIESEPVALIRTPELRPVDARGRVLPVSLAGMNLDAPIIAHTVKLADDSVADDATQQLIAALLRIRSHDAALAHDVSEIGHAAGGGLRLRLRRPGGAELLLPALPEARTLREVRMALEHLHSETLQAAGTTVTALHRLARMEARYPDELFVMLRPPGTE